MRLNSVVEATERVRKSNQLKPRRVEIDTTYVDAANEYHDEPASSGGPLLEGDDNVEHWDHDQSGGEAGDALLPGGSAGAATSQNSLVAEAGDDDEQGFWDEIEAQVDEALARADLAEQRLAEALAASKAREEELSEEAATLISEADARAKAAEDKLEEIRKAPKSKSKAVGNEQNTQLAAMRLRAAQAEQELAELQRSVDDRNTKLTDDLAVQRDLATLLEAEAQREQAARIEAETLAQDAVAQAEALQLRLAELEQVAQIGAAPVKLDHDALQAQVDKLQHDLCEEKNARDAAENRAKAANESSERLKLELAKLEAALESGEELSRRLSEANGLLEASRKETARVRAALALELENEATAREAAENRTRDALAQLADLQTELEALRASQSKHAADMEGLAELRSQLESAQLENDSLRTADRERAEELEKLGTACRMAEAQVETALAGKKALEEEIARLRVVCANQESLADQLAQANEELGVLNSERDLTKRSLADVNARLEAAEAGRVEALRCNAEDKARIEELEAQIAGLLAAPDKKQELAERELAASREVELLNREVGKLRALVNGLKGDVQRESAARLSAEQEVANAQRLAHVAGERIATLEAFAREKTDTESKEADSQRSEIDNLGARIAELNRTVALEVEAKQAAQAAAERAAAQAEDAVTQLRTLQSLNDSRNEAAERKSVAVQAVERDLEELRKKLEAETSAKQQAETEAEALALRLVEAEKRLASTIAEYHVQASRLSRAGTRSESETSAQASEHQSPPSRNMGEAGRGSEAENQRKVAGSAEREDYQSTPDQEAAGVRQFSYEIPSKVPTRLRAPARNKTVNPSAANPTESAEELSRTDGNDHLADAQTASSNREAAEAAASALVDEGASEKRRDKRVESQIPAVLNAEGLRQGLTCTIRDRSSSGARIEFTRDMYVEGVEVVSVGDRLTLTFRMGQDRTSVECVVAWVAGRLTGVRFVGQFRTESVQTKRKGKAREGDDRGAGKSGFSAGRFAKTILSGR